MKLYAKLFSAFLLSLVLWSCSENTGTSPTEDPPTNFSHKQATGSSGYDFLSSENYNSLIIEVDYVEGFQPTQSALDNLKSFLEARLNKPGGITVMLDESIASPGNDSFTPQQIADLEDEHRDTFTEGNTIAAYFLILDGAYEQENVLGVAYYNTSMALFEEVIRNNSGGIGQPSASTVESAVLQHEFGHILGLVDNGTGMVQDHEDPEHEKHCNEESCLMYYAIQTTDLMGNLSGGNIPELDSQCLQDLQANGGK